MGVLCCPALYCTVLCWTVLYCTALYCTVPYCAPYALPSIVAIPHQVVSLVLSTARIRQSQWYSVLCTALYRALYCTVLPCTVPHWAVLYRAALYCTVLYCAPYTMPSIVARPLALRAPQVVSLAFSTARIRESRWYTRTVHCPVPCIVLYCAVLHCTALYWTALHCTALYCTATCCAAYCACRLPYLLVGQTSGQGTSGPPVARSPQSWIVESGSFSTSCCSSMI